MKKLCIVTSTRAEYGLLSPIIKRMQHEKKHIIDVVVTGMHLSPDFGCTYKEIERDGVHINKKIEILMNGDSDSAVSKSMALAIMGFADYFDEAKPDALLILGDRYEILAVCCAAMNAHIPIIHLHGGETTEGAIDEAVRHSISKMSYLHLTATEEYRRRVIQLGEHPTRVFNVGAIGVENTKRLELLSIDNLSKELKLDLSKPYAIVTYHPVTLDKDHAEEEIYSLLDAINSFDDMNYIFTKANADAGGRRINEIIEKYIVDKDNMFLFDSLGALKYLSAVKHCEMVIGNSSSGIIEVPSFKKPTINIGDRQKRKDYG